MSIHPTAIVDPAAELDPSVTVGAYSLIGPHVKIAAGTKVGPHCVIEGHTTIGRDNTFFQFSSIGAANQDKKYAGEPTTLVIGDRNTIREFCTLNVGTVQDRGETTLGNDNWIMAYCHLAHDVVIGNECVLANNATLAGHVHVGDHVTIGGLTGILQRMRIGDHAMIGFQAHVAQDVPPFMTVDGNPLAARLQRRAHRRHPPDLQAALPQRPHAGRGQGGHRGAEGQRRRRGGCRYRQHARIPRRLHARHRALI
jgi:UDP-N-acetylglucosamine acyltransferase